MKVLYYETLREGLVRVKDPVRLGADRCGSSSLPEWEVTVVSDHHFWSVDGVKLTLYPAGYKITTIARYLVHKAGFKGPHQMVVQADLPGRGKQVKSGVSEGSNPD